MRRRGRHRQRPADYRIDQQWFGFGFGNRRRGAAGPSQGGYPRQELFWQGSVQTIIPLGRNGAIKHDATLLRRRVPRSRPKGSYPTSKSRKRGSKCLKATRGANVMKRTCEARSTMINRRQKMISRMPKTAKTKPTRRQKRCRNGVDYQLARALDLLRGLALYRNRDGELEEEPEASFFNQAERSGPLSTISMMRKTLT